MSSQHHRFDPEHLLRTEEQRLAVLAPGVVLAELLGDGVKTLADIGAGVGFYTLEAATRLPSGKVYALDHDPRMLKTIHQRAATLGLSNIVTLEADAGALPLEDGAVDVVLMANVLHDFADPIRALSEAKRILRDGGSFALVEWDKVPTKMGPPLEIRIAPTELVERVEQAGFQVDRLILEPSPFYRLLAHKLLSKEPARD